VSDTSKFVIVYDQGSSSQNSFTGTLGYDVTRSINVGVLGAYYSYSTDQVMKAWHLPSYRIDLTGSFLFGQKIKLTTDLKLLGGMQARNPSDGSAIDLSNITNIDLGLHYLISDRASVFVNGYNLLGQSYQRYLYYSSRELQLIAGLSYSF